MKLRLVVSALALCACGGSPSPELAPAPSNTASEMTFAEIVNGARALEMWRVDATTLGERVDAYLAVRSGEWFDARQTVDLVLVLMGDGETLRIDLGDWQIAAPTPTPFGALDAVAGCAEDGHDLACEELAWAGGEPLFALTLDNAVDDPTRCSVSVKDGELVFVAVDGTWTGDEPEEWSEQRLALAPGARVFNPVPTIVPPVLGDPVVVRVSEVVTAQNSVTFYDISVRVGDRLGPLAMQLAVTPDRDHWLIPAVPDALPGPLPEADAYLAHRVYRTDTDADWYLLGRVDDALVGWFRFTGPYVVENTWQETLRVPIPHDAEVVVR